MGRLFLVRHAQASFLSQNYDKLSDLGERQSRLLGEYWVRHRVMFDRVCTGPAIRHRQTARIAGEAYRRVGLEFPEPVILKEFDEFQGEAVLARSLPQLLAHNRKIHELHDAMQNSGDEIEKRANFQRLFEAVISMWVHGEIAPESVESWQEFCARVNRGLTTFLANSWKGEMAVIFTSSGPLSAAVERALHLSAQDTLQIAWMSRNCSFSEFLFSSDRFTLSTFNSFPHLDDDLLLTYR
ncbi:MAG TPA: histidine phosphatase family protein [Candidatus Acidoferrum sp.]|jgi:broad specificity phosphatase PhoE|nr:histidine phosphatase family protein [Candidatus Acidoferrum sp.]